MTEFYKDKFNLFYQERMLRLKVEEPTAWQRQIKEGGLTATSKVEMDKIVNDFIAMIFGGDVMYCLQSQRQKDHLTKRVMTVLFSHRHTKNDRFIEETD